MRTVVMTVRMVMIKKDDDNIDEDEDNHDDDDCDQKWDANDHLVPLGSRQLKRDWELWQHALVGLVHLTGLLSCIFKVGDLQHHNFHHQKYFNIIIDISSSSCIVFNSYLLKFLVSFSGIEFS